MVPQKAISLVFLFYIGILAISCNDDAVKKTPELKLANLYVGPFNINLQSPSGNTEVPIDKPILGTFTAGLNISTAEEAIELKIKSSQQIIPLTFTFLDNNKTFAALPGTKLISNETYTLVISEKLKGINNETFAGLSVDFTTTHGSIDLISVSLDGSAALNSDRIVDVSVDKPTIEIFFSDAVDPATINTQNIFVHSGSLAIPLTLTLSEENKKLTVETGEKLRDLTKYQMFITDQVRGLRNETFQQYSRIFHTAIDPTPDFPVISDDELLTQVQQQTFKYFWDFAHPASGLARERNTSGNIVTSGGSGFGIMSIIVAIERNFITRQEGLDRLDKMLDFLETADRFHGAWSHWIDGETGDVIPFSNNDNGGDLVETSFLVQGLLTFRQYLAPGVPAEQTLIDRINTLWQAVEWDWYRQSGQDVLYWHWSPDKQWIMNHQIKGYNEALITYLLSAASPAHSIDAPVYHVGWAGNGSIVNGKTFYDITLPLGYDYGGPLFFAHYSFLGLDPRNLQDTYSNYWTQNVNHTLINQAYCIDNPKNFVGYSDENWGLTASDNHQGYSAHSPTNDLGVITPTAALSSFPYTPAESMKALKFFYYTLGDRLWGAYGFYDAFNLTEGWVASSYLAIDQGPVIVMIENYRTGLLWDLFMSAPEIQDGLNKLSFTY